MWIIQIDYFTKNYKYIKTKDLEMTNFKKYFNMKLNESKLVAGKGKVTIEIDWMLDDQNVKKLINSLENKYKLKIKYDEDDAVAKLTGEKSDLIKYLTSQNYDLADEDVEDMFPELLK